MDRFSIYRIVWRDAVSIDAWYPVDELKLDRSAKVETVGILLHEDKDRYLIALNYDVTNDKSSCVMIIPKRFVDSVEVLKSYKAEK